MKFKIVYLILMLVTVLSYSQENNLVRIENFILEQKLDSATFYISKQKAIEANTYLSVLNRIATNSNVTYKDFYTFVLHVGIYRSKNDFNQLSNFIEQIPKPKNNKQIDLDYVYIKWLYNTKLRDKGKLAEATIVFNELETYVNQFDKTKTAVVKANLLLDTHKIVLMLIEKNLEDGKELSLQGLKKSEALNDETLEIIYLNHLCDFLISEGKLDEYINKCEKSISLENKLQTKSTYYVSTIAKLIDAYIYKGGNENRINELLNILYVSSNREHVYSSYANYLRSLEKNSQITKDIFKRFGVTNYISFCEAIENRSREILDPNDFYYVLSRSSQLLQEKGFLNEAIGYKSKCETLTRTIYSEELSNSLANFKTEQAIKEKELEIKYEKEKSSLYSIIIGLSALVLVSLIFVVFRKFKQEKLLKAKNIEIEEQRDAIKKKEKEKDLLLREVHHRVKNNFQIVSSLLELQTKGIEDEKALEMANEGKNRVKSMALIHQKLYQNDDNFVNFDEYIHLLVNELTSMYASNKKITTTVNSENMMFDVDTAIPLGLIINELITNAYKYAFSGNKENSLNISIAKDSEDFYKLVVSDNGPGLNSTIDIKKVKSLGLRLVTRLAKQLQGSVLQTNSNGAYFEILFKDTIMRRQLN